jgi:hypothetical protein
MHIRAGVSVSLSIGGVCSLALAELALLIASSQRLQLILAFTPSHCKLRNDFLSWSPLDSCRHGSLNDGYLVNTGTSNKRIGLTRCGKLTISAL